MISELIVPAQSKHETQRFERHIITPEYPPQPGGVSDYTRQVAEGLVEGGEEVHVWCPATEAQPSPGCGYGAVHRDLHVHRDLGRITPQDLENVGEQLDRFPGPRRILVQWVPHGYGRRSMNVPFCIWLWRRAKKHGDIVEIMVHEAFLTFEGSWRQYGAALIHRLMTVILARSATRAWFSAAECRRRWESYGMARHIPLQCLPVPSNIPVAWDDTAVREVRRRYVPEGGLLVGHFGTYGMPVLSVLDPILRKMSHEVPGQPLLLLGRGSCEIRSRLIQQDPAWEKNLHATGPLSPEELSCHISACDLLIQPFPDGASTRRTSLMVGLCHGKAILTTSSQATEPIWGNSAAVSLTPSGDAAAFVMQMRKLLQDPGERARLSHAAQKLYQERFDISHTVAALRLTKSESAVCAS